MKSILIFGTRSLASTVLIGLCALNANAAQWSSIRSNNRGHASAAPAVHAQPVPAPHNFPSPTGRTAAREENALRENRAHEVERGHDAEREIRERRHLDIDEDRRRAFHWDHFHPGMTVGVLPLGYLPLYVGGATYYYSDGVYYEPAPEGYVVVNPPMGVAVPGLPPGAETVMAGDSVYYYAGGVFYAQGPNGYEVVQAPLGVTVGSLPSDAVQVTVNGRFYYQARGVYYLPVMQDGVTVFVTAQP